MNVFEQQGINEFNGWVDECINGWVKLISGFMFVVLIDPLAAFLIHSTADAVTCLHFILHMSFDLKPTEKL